MDARRVLRRIRAAGLDLREKKEGLAIAPAENLTRWIEDLIRRRKSELLELLRRFPSPKEEVSCLDCGSKLPLGGVRCPSCRDAHHASTCASCGVVVEDPDLSVCDLCSLEARGLRNAVTRTGEET